MPVPVESTPVETESVQSAQTARPVVAVLGEPGTRGALVKLLQDAGADVIVPLCPISCVRLTVWWLPAV